MREESLSNGTQVRCVTQTKNLVLGLSFVLGVTGCQRTFLDHREKLLAGDVMSLYREFGIGAASASGSLPGD